MDRDSRASGTPGRASETGGAVQVTCAMVAIGSGDPAHLAEIRHPGISLAEWWRRPPVDVPVEDLIGLELVEFSATRDGVGPAMRSALDETGNRRWHETLSADADRLATRFASIMEVDRLAIRLESIADDACTRFHADHVSVRLLCTYVGPGTEWLTGSEETAARIHRLGTGHVGLFKGLLWGPITSVLHRSPPLAGTGGWRLLLVIDVAEVSAAGQDSH